MTNPLVIIGTGLAGYMLAKEFRKCDTTRAMHLYTTDQGAFYSKPLLSTALTQQKTPEQLAVNSVEEMAAQLDATIHTETTVEDIAALSYAQLVLATGATKMVPPLSGDAAQSVVSVNNLSDYAAFRRWLSGKKNLLMIGAGLVGCEFTNDLVNAGYRVHVAALEAAPLAALVPPVIGEDLRAALAALGVTWHLGCAVTSVDAAGSGYQVRLSSGEVLQVDGVFSAVGLRPNVALAEKAGLAVREGIVVDHYFQTSQPNIYALGDCAEVAGRVAMYVAPILHGARTLAKTLAGEKTAVQYPVMPIVIKTPACPVVALPPPKGVEGTWHYEGETAHQRALFYDTAQQLRGFALIGDKVRDRMALAKQLPVV